LIGDYQGWEQQMELGITTFAETYSDPTTRQDLGIERFLLHVSVGTLPHAQVQRSIELLGTEVAPFGGSGTGRHRQVSDH